MQILLEALSPICVNSGEVNRLESPDVAEV